MNSPIKKILVTGGAGYIGSHTVRQLLKKGFKVVVLDNLSLGHKESVDQGAVIEKNDLKNKDAVYRTLQKHQPDAIIDFAAYAMVSESQEDPQKYLVNNIYNFINLLEATVKTGCKFLIKSSTCALYGNPNEKDFPIKEDYHRHRHFTKSHLMPADFKGKSLSGENLFQPIIAEIQRHLPKSIHFSNCNLADMRAATSVYGLTKMVDEILMNKYFKKHRLNSVALRYFNACGADDFGDIGEDHDPELALIPNLICKALGQQPEFILNGNDYPTPDGTVIRDYVHVNDLAIGHISALHYLESNPGFSVFNLGNGKGYSVKEIISETEKQIGEPVDIIIGPRRTGDAIKIYGDISKAQKLLNWKPKYNLSMIIKTAITWHRSHPNGYHSK